MAFIWPQILFTFLSLTVGLYFTFSSLPTFTYCRLYFVLNLLVLIPNNLLAATFNGWFLNLHQLSSALDVADSFCAP